MALAYLCSQLRRWDPWFKVSDNPLSKFFVYIVDHKLREGSSEEAKEVKRVVTDNLGMKADVLTLDWKLHLGEGVNPAEQTNMESLARRLRYRRLGSACRFHNVVSLFLAHHQDDQYETVLMRLLSGHGVRGLRGMRPAADIPECQGMYQVYQSGFIDDQMNSNPWYNMKPSVNQRRALRRQMRDEIDPALLAQEMRHGVAADADAAYLAEDFAQLNKGPKWAPPLEPLDIEDGGINVYRPLLGFGKDRLIATCVQNKIPWFEDRTNDDRTLTMRNAVRHLYKNYEMPLALQKPAILRLSERCNARAAAEEAEAERLFSRAVIHDFEPNVGTMMVELPHMSVPRVARRYQDSDFRRKRRRELYRRIAAILIRKILALVSPESQITPAANLQPFVTRLFTSLAEDDGGSNRNTAAATAPEPKSFVVCGVHFVPLKDGHSLRWYLSRAPHPSQIPRPLTEFPRLYFRHRTRPTPSKWKFSTWFAWQLFDGRFWIRIRHRLPFRLQIRPFEAEFSKPFREGLVNDEARETLAATLRKYAPGKVRYTLPGIYSTANVDPLLRGSAHWRGDGVLEDDVVLKMTGLGENAAKITGGSQKPYTTEKNSDTAPLLPGWYMEERQPKELQLLALPTLGFHVAGLEDWVQWDIRYRKVDLGFLATGMTDDAREHRGRVLVRRSAKGSRLRRPLHGLSRRKPRVSTRAWHG